MSSLLSSFPESDAIDLFGKRKKDTKTVNTPYLRLFIRCKNIKREFFTHINPMAVLFIKDPESGLFYELGRTNVVQNDLNPEFQKSILVNVEKVKANTKWDPTLKRFTTSNVQGMNLASVVIGKNIAKESEKTKEELEMEEQTRYGEKNLRFVIVDVETRNSEIRSEDILGYVDWRIQQLTEISDTGVKNTSMTLSLPLKIRDQIRGKIKIIGEWQHEPTMDWSIRLKLAAEDLPMYFWEQRFGVVNGWLPTTDPFFKVYRKIRSGSRAYKHLIYVSEPIPSNNCPYWQEILLPYNHWCNAMEFDDLWFEFWNWDISGTFTYIGEFKATTSMLLEKEQKTSKSEKEMKITKRTVKTVWSCYACCTSKVGTARSVIIKFEIVKPNKEVTNRPQTEQPLSLAQTQLIS